MEESEGHQYSIASYWEHLVSQYTGLNMLQVDELDFLLYLQYRRDAFINKMNQTEKGQEYLDNAYRINQTAPNRKRLREQFGKEVSNG